MMNYRCKWANGKIEAYEAVREDGTIAGKVERRRDALGFRSFVAMADGVTVKESASESEAARCLAEHLGRARRPLEDREAIPG